MTELFPPDVIKKRNSARTYNKKVEYKMAKQFHDTKGLENQFKYQLYELKQEQDTLKKEFERLKYLSIRSSKDFERKHGTIHHAEPNLRHHHRVDDHRKNCPVTASKMAEPGKNFFGYHSAPGSHKPEDKTLNELEKELEDYFHKPDQLMRKQRASRQLKHQKQENENVQEKVDKWKTKTSSRRRFSITEPPNLRHLAFLRDELVHQTTNENSKEASTEREITKIRPKTVAVVGASSSNDEEIHRSGSKMSSNKDLKGLEKHRRNSKPTHELENIKPATASIVRDPVDDFDLYAPDGRLRMALRMPDVDKAFKEAGKARYVRTRHKREFERQISNSQIFTSLHQENK